MSARYSFNYFSMMSLGNISLVTNDLARIWCPVCRFSSRFVYPRVSYIIDPERQVYCEVQGQIHTSSHLQSDLSTAEVSEEVNSLVPYHGFDFFVAQLMLGSNQRSIVHSRLGLSRRRRKGREP